VRELTNILERAFVLCHEQQIGLIHIPAEVVEGRGKEEAMPPSPQRGPARPEVQQFLDTLNAHGWRRGETARALGISRSTLWRRMKEYGLV
jgi:transcriptional regulator of acetoin/glycerol metabolism